MTKYAAEQQDVLDALTESGGPIVFLADQFRGGSIAADVTGVALEIPGDPDEYRALNLVTSNPVTLMVAAKGLSVTPMPGVAFRWGSRHYTVKSSTPLAPDSDAIYWTIIGAS